MKNMILTISIIIGCCLANTGMLADKGDAAFGIWANVSRQVDCEDCEEFKEISLEYMTKVGLEIGLSAGQLGDMETAGGYLSYHFKSNSLYKKGTNFYISYGVDDFYFEDEDDPYAEKGTFSVGFYSNKKSYFEISQETTSMNFMGYEYEDENEFVKFGGTVRFGSKGALTIGYKIDVDVIDAIFENEDFEYFKDGVLELSVGGNF